MVEACRAKFTQNAHLRDFLMLFLGTHIIDANPKDKVWAVGIGLKDKHLFDQAHWDGSNWMGDILMGLYKEFV